MAEIQDIKETLIAGNAIRLTEQVRSALEEGLSALRRTRREHAV